MSDLGGKILKSPGMLPSLEELPPPLDPDEYVSVEFAAFGRMAKMGFSGAKLREFAEWLAPRMNPGEKPFECIKRLAREAKR